MSFVLIAPEGWTALDTEYYENNTGLTKQLLKDTAITTIMEVSAAALIEHGDMTPEQTIEEIKVIDDNFWVKLV